jgi:hypothetical protein
MHGYRLLFLSKNIRVFYNPQSLIYKISANTLIPMLPPPTNHFLTLFFTLVFIMGVVICTKAQDSTAHITQDTTITQKPAPHNSTFRRLLPHWNIDVKKSDGPTAAGVIIRANPITWAAYYSYEYILRNVFWVPGS